MFLWKFYSNLALYQEALRSLRAAKHAPPSVDYWVGSHNPARKRSRVDGIQVFGLQTDWFEWFFVIVSIQRLCCPHSIQAIVEIHAFSNSGVSKQGCQPAFQLPDVSKDKMWCIYRKEIYATCLLQVIHSHDHHSFWTIVEHPDFSHKLEVPESCSTLPASSAADVSPNVKPTPERRFMGDVVFFRNLFRYFF